MNDGKPGSSSSSLSARHDTTSVAAELVAALREIGVKYVFGVPSGGWVDYMEALRTADGISFVLATHEGGAGMMADVCGRLSGVPGVCFGTFGPGATNLATGVGEALLDRSPMIALTDEMPAGMRGRVTQMGIDHQALFRPLTKHTTRLTAENVRDTVFAAARLAMEKRPGPVHIGLPVGLSAQPTSPSREPFRQPAPALVPDQASLAQAAKLLTEARRPLLAIGLGAVQAGIAAELRVLAEKHQMPVVLTPMAKGMLPEDHPLYVGVLFHALSDIVGETHKHADVVFAAGYDPVEFNFESWLSESTRLINIDVVPADIDRDTYTVAADVVGDLRTAVNHLLATPSHANDWDMKAVAMRREAMFAKLRPTNTAAFGPMGALAVLRDILPDDAIMTCDVGAHTHLIGQTWRTPAPRLQIMTNGWSTMGFGIPAAIAAKLTRPDAAVCAVVGDGGFLMTAGELATAVRLNLKIVVVVLSDNDLALIRIKQEKKGNPIYGTPVREKGAIGGNDIFGVPVLSSRDSSEFRAALEKAFATEGPCIVEAIVDSREYDSVVLKKDKV